MKKIIRPLTIVLAVILCLALIAGCDNAKPGASSSQAPASSSQGTSATDKTEILVGYVAPFTGPLGFFTEQYEWSSKKCLDAINADGGIYIEAYGKKLPVRIITADTESDPNRASEVATNLVLNNNLDFLIGAWTPDTSLPVSAVAERYKIPALMENSPAEAWFTGGPYEWASAMMFYNRIVVDAFVEALVNFETANGTNKKVGFVFDSDTDGLMFAESYAEAMPAAGFTVYDPGRFPASTNDYTSIINQLKSEDCDIAIGNMLTPDFTTFWGQCQQLGYVPKVMMIGRGEEFMSAVVALGNTEGHGIMSETMWNRELPYRSSLLNLTSAELCDKYEAEVKKPYSYCLGNDVTIFEIMNDMLRRCKDLERDTVMAALLATDIDTVGGHMAFDKNRVSPLPGFIIQWVNGETWTYEPSLVASTEPGIKLNAPIVIPNYTTGK